MVGARGHGRGGRGRGFGPSRGPDSTTQLPAALRKELGIEDAAPAPQQQHGRPTHFAQSSRGRQQVGVLGRKDARKEARAAKKAPARPQVQSQHSSSSKRRHDGADAAAGPSKRPASASAQGPPPKKAKVASKDAVSASSKAEGKKKVAFASTTTKEDDATASRSVQRKHVNAKTQTPLERMLAAQHASNGASSTSLSPGLPATGSIEPPRRKKRSKMTQAEKDEEDEIAWLEAKLKLRGSEGGKGDNEEGDDGLGGLIRELDRYQTGMFEQPGEDESEESDSEEEEEDESSDEQMLEEDSEEEEEEDEDLAAFYTDEDNDSDSTAQLQSKGADESKRAASTTAPSTAPEAASLPSGKYIPPALRRAAAEAASNAEATPGTSKPNISSTPTVDPKLQRTLNGLLNRLSSANLDAILVDILAAYGSYPRAVVTQTLVKLVLETVALQPNLVDSIVILYAALFCALGRSVGVEFGAEAVQVLVGRLVHAHAQIRRRQEQGSVSQADQDDRAGRECLNLAVLLAHTYNLHLVAAPLIYDVVRLCLRESAAARAGQDLELVHLRSVGDEDGATRIEAMVSPEQGIMQEIDVELLLKLVKACGSQMRSDDPSALRDIVALTQERINGSDENSTAALGSRARFMLEALIDLQKARSKPKAGAAAFGADGTVAAEALARYKKYIASMSKRPERLLRSSAASGVSNTDEPLLNIGLRDLADSTRKGRWWLVGAAWTGHGDEGEVSAGAEGVTAKRKLLKKGETQGIDGASSVDGLTKRGGATKTSNSASDASLALLAREHGMNTDARRSVFITLMSSEDYVDASQHLLGLGLNEVQRREVVRVLLHCLGSEPVYNPYYVLIGQQLAADAGAAGGPVLATSSTSGVISTRVTMQYCLWDYFREIGESDVGGATMIASGKGAGDDDDEDEFKGFDDAFGETVGAEEGELGAVSRKMVHLARAYGWWMGKGALNLNILRTVNFAALKQRGRAFVQLLLVHMLLSIQTVSPTKTLTLAWSADKAASRYRPQIENTLVRGTAGNLELARGLLIFVKRHMRSAELMQVAGGAGLKKGTKQALEWAVKVAEEVLEVGIQVAGQV
ncbi:suppressor of glycerol defect [Tilletia horrida]|uniref:Suppressor of glycerol defect n=1 Tax=Tilletia horrida TaxID=155126 RepID=A0AAN6GAE8_9BASI|nr:suppressor of glycerol defect [Tilletia horrida]